MLCLFLRQKDIKDRYCDADKKDRLSLFAMLTYFRHRDTHFEYIVKE